MERKQREFAQALTNGDAEHVVDDERGDECGDQRKDQQSCAERTDDAAELVRGFVANLLAGEHFGVGGQNGGDRLFHRVEICTVIDGDIERVEHAFRTENFGGVRRVEVGGGGTADVLTVFAASDADQDEVTLRRCRR